MVLIDLESDPTVNRRNDRKKNKSTSLYTLEGRSWVYEDRRVSSEVRSPQLRKAAAQARRPIDRDVVEHEVPQKTVSGLRKQLEFLKGVSFVISAVCSGGVVLAFLLMGASFQSGSTVTLPRNFALLFVSLLLLIVARRLRSRVSHFLRSDNI